jgi:hypothetical protein
MKNLIGTSLSYCMRDILSEKVDICNISAIVSSTAFTTPEKALESYYDIYWTKYNKDYVLSTLKNIWPLLCQPRLNHDLREHRGHYSVKGHWLNTETGVFSTNP